MAFEQNIRVLCSPENLYQTIKVKATDFPDAKNVGELIELACLKYKLDRKRVRFNAYYWKIMDLNDAVPDGEHLISEVSINRLKVIQLIEKLLSATDSDEAQKAVIGIKKIVDPSWINANWLKENIFVSFINSCDTYALSIDSETIEQIDVENIQQYLASLKFTCRVS